MGLRFFCAGGVGWVAEMGGRHAGCAHSLEKSVTIFGNASIDCLYRTWENLPGFVACPLTKCSS
jgi:hypothetical protein